MIQVLQVQLQLLELHKTKEEMMDEFMDLINATRNLAAELKVKFEKESFREKANDAKVQELSECETLLSEKGTDLNQREAKIVGIESIVRLKDDAIALKKQAEKAMAEVIAERESDRLAMADAKAIQFAGTKKLNEDKATHIDDIALLKKGWDQLRAKEKTYKDEIKVMFQNKLR